MKFERLGSKEVDNLFGVLGGSIEKTVFVRLSVVVIPILIRSSLSSLFLSSRPFSWSPAPTSHYFYLFWVNSPCHVPGVQTVIVFLVSTKDTRLGSPGVLSSNHVYFKDSLFVPSNQSVMNPFLDLSPLFPLLNRKFHSCLPDRPYEALFHTLLIDKK